MPVYKFYLLNVSATDGGRPARGAWALLNISVTDFNDNEPAFNQSAYTVHVKEDVDTDSVVYVFAATDADSGANSEVSRPVYIGAVVTGGLGATLLGLLPFLQAILLQFCVQNLRNSFECSQRSVEVRTPYD